MALITTVKSFMIQAPAEQIKFTIVKSNFLSIVLINKTVK